MKVVQDQEDYYHFREKAVEGKWLLFVYGLAWTPGIRLLGFRFSLVPYPSACK